MGEQILVDDVGAEEGWIVRVEGDEKPGIEVAAERMSGKRRTNAGAHIRGWVQLKHNAPCSQRMKKIRVVHRRENVPKAFRSDVEGFPDRVRPRGLAGVVGQAQARISRGRVNLSKRLGAAAAFVAAEPMPTIEGNSARIWAAF